MNIFRKTRISFLILLTLTVHSAAAQSLRPVVSGIEAKALSSNKITVSWHLPKKTEGSSISSLLIFKDTRPIVSKESIEKLKPLAQLPWSATSYTDTVKDFHEYYYAVLSFTRKGDYEQKDNLYFDEELDAVAETDQGELLLVILPGVNSTVNGVRVKTPAAKKDIPEKTESAKERLYNKNELRDKPLPFIDVLGTVNNPDPKISAASEEKVLKLVGGKNVHRKTAPLEVYYFEEDLVSATGGDDYLLFEVLRTSFVNADYSTSIKTLEKFLAQKRSSSVTARATFYLGEAYYFTGDFKKAIDNFILLNDVYPSLSRKWIENALELYNLPSDQH